MGGSGAAGEASANGAATGLHGDAGASGRAAALDESDAWSAGAASIPFDAASCSAETPPEAALVSQALAEALAVTVAQVMVACVQEVTWPDGCLGEPAPELCYPGPIPGYIITLEALNSYYSYHTSQKGAWLFAGPGSSPQRP